MQIGVSIVVDANLQSLIFTSSVEILQFVSWRLKVMNMKEI